MLKLFYPRIPIRTQRYTPLKNRQDIINAILKRLDNFTDKELYDMLDYLNEEAPSRRF